MRTKKPIIAMIYDFDGTLSPGNMQEFGFIQAVNKKAETENVSLQRKSFQEFGKEIELFKGVKEWFNLINDCGRTIGVKVEHYVNSSGLIEMIEGTPIAKEFKKIYACSYLYDVDGKAIWPAVAVNYTTKTQFLFKINKGIDSIYDNKKVNEYIADNERRVPFSQMIYFGDGETDIPCMKLIKEQGGHSIAVYKPRDSKKKKTSEKLIIENRVNFACSAAYTDGSEIFKDSYDPNPPKDKNN